MEDGLRERLLIREVIECWAICRDSGDWEGLRACFHPDGIMNATWFQGDVERFVSGAMASFERNGVSTASSGRDAYRGAAGRPGGRADAGDDFLARRAGWGDVRHPMHRAVLRFFRETRRGLGDRGAAADL